MIQDYGMSVFSRKGENLDVAVAEAKSEIVEAVKLDGLTISEDDLVTWQDGRDPRPTPVYVWLPSPTHPWGYRSFTHNLTRWRDTVARVQ